MDWPRPVDVQSLRRFLGLASYYRRYIQQFANIASPLHTLTQKAATFSWTTECENAFRTLKDCLVTSPVLVYPDFSSTASQFVLQTDASDVGIGAVLEQDDHVVAYASRSLTKSERNYSVIQKECLAAVYAMKQFRHYLLGRKFKLLTDHAPLQWLSAQKMEGLLSRWALAIQEYDFQIQYRKGSLNGNADALSRRDGSPPTEDQCAVTIADTTAEKQHLHQSQQQDPVIEQIYMALKAKHLPSTPAWKQSPLQRYRQLWSQLRLVDDLVCREYFPPSEFCCHTGSYTFAEAPHNFPASQPRYSHCRSSRFRENSPMSTTGGLLG